jgi:hypothetical protein
MPPRQQDEVHHRLLIVFSVVTFFELQQKAMLGAHDVLASIDPEVGGDMTVGEVHRRPWSHRRGAVPPRSHWRLPEVSAQDHVEWWLCVSSNTGTKPQCDFR